MGDHPLKTYSRCQRKRRYTTKRAAAKGWGKRVYECPDCGGWHRSKKAWTREPRGGTDD